MNSSLRSDLRKRKILVLGVSGMLGNSVFRYLNSLDQFDTFGTVRCGSAPRYLSFADIGRLLLNTDAANEASLIDAFIKVKPDVVINCIGIVKQLDISEDPIATLPINSIFPHKLARLCELTCSRLIHISTDCVFTGKQGHYKESDVPDATDVYGISKKLGEVYYPHTITLRTSIIGHELNGARSLIDWFLSQTGEVLGFTHAFFSGLPTFELARIIANYVIPNNDLSGLYHVSADRISKFDLLHLIREQYTHPVHIRPVSEPIIDRSLDSSRFKLATGYKNPSWPELVSFMRETRHA